MKRSATIAIAAVAATTAIACSIATGQWLVPTDPKNPTAAQATPPSQEVSAVNAHLRTDAQIETVTYYSLCGHKTIVRTNADASEIGKTREQLSTLFPNATLTSFSTALAVFEVSVPLHCPQHFILRADDTGLGVYQTVEGTGQQAEVATFHLNVTVLPKEIQVRLQNGLAFSSLSEIEAYLEDLDS